MAIPKLPTLITDPLAYEVERSHQPEAVKKARSAWRAFWLSPAAVDFDESDRVELDHWIVAVFRREVYTRIMLSGPIAEPHPLDPLIAAATLTIDRVVDRLGIGSPRMAHTGPVDMSARLNRSYGESTNAD